MFSSAPVAAVQEALAAVASPTLTAGVNTGTINNGNGQVTISWTAPTTMATTAAMGTNPPSSTGNQPVTSSTTVTPPPASVAPTSTVIPVGNVPQGVGIDPSRHTAYVTNFADNTVSVIDGASNKVIATIVEIGG